MVSKKRKLENLGLKPEDYNNTDDYLSPETRTFVTMFGNDVFSGEQKHKLITILADVMHREKQLTDEEVGDAIKSAKLFLEGKAFKQIYRKSFGVQKIIFRLLMGRAEILETEEGLGVICYSPLTTFMDNLKKLSVKDADKIMITIIEKMRIDGVITQEDADGAFKDFNVQEFKSQGTYKVLKLIDEEYAYLKLLSGKAVLGFKKNGNTEAFEDFKNRLKDVGMID